MAPSLNYFSKFSVAYHDIVRPSMALCDLLLSCMAFSWPFMTKYRYYRTCIVFSRGFSPNSLFFSKKKVKDEYIRFALFTICPLVARFELTERL